MSGPSVCLPAVLQRPSLRVIVFTAKVFARRDKQEIFRREVFGKIQTKVTCQIKYQRTTVWLTNARSLKLYSVRSLRTFVFCLCSLLPVGANGDNRCWHSDDLDIKF